MSVYDLLLDAAIASTLILLGQFLRAKVKLFQQFFIPASMMAGFIGLALGGQGLGLLAFSSGVGSYTGVLILMIFAVVGINGFEFSGGGGGGAKGDVKRLLSFIIYRFIGLSIQFIIPLTVTLTIIKVVAPEVNSAIGVLVAAGFIGGHGTAAAVSNTLAEMGWADAADLGMTFATIGILTGIFGGLAFVKWAARKGHTGYIKDFAYISGDLRTGLVSKENRNSVGDDTISSVSLDTLCFHLSMVTALAGAGYALNKFFIAPYILSGVPDFTVTYLIALIYFVVMRKTPVYDYIDTKLNNKIAGTCTDYLVFFGVATINIAAIVTYIVPLVILTISAFFCVAVLIIPLGPLFNKDSWFERALFTYGYSTGVFAIGFVLLRIVDPDNKCKVINDIAMSPFLSFIEVLYWSLIPSMLITGQGWLVVGVITVSCIACFVVAGAGKLMYFTPVSQRKILGVDAIEE